MSAETNSSAGPSDYGNALVAALGFEPTDTLEEGSSATVVAEPTDGSLDPSIVSPPTGEAGDTMSVKKGKGRGPRTSAAKRATSESGSSEADSDPSTNSGRASVGNDPNAGDWLNARDDQASAVTADASPIIPTDDVATGLLDADTTEITGPVPIVPTDDGSSSASNGSSGASIPAVDFEDTLLSGSLPDAASSGVRPLRSATPGVSSPGLNGGTDATTSGEQLNPVKVTPVVSAAAPAGPTASAAPAAPTAEAPGQPVLPPTGPPTGPPMVTQPGMQPMVQPGGSLRESIRTESVADKMSGLASKVPQLLDGGLLERNRRVRARKVRRVVRHIDPWSVLTFSVLFHLCVFAALLLSSVLVWNAAVAAGTIENIESFIRELGDYTTYEIKGDVVFRAAMVIAGILTLASSVLMVLLTVVFNLISDLVGGIRLTVVEEETVRVRRKRNQ